MHCVFPSGRSCAHVFTPLDRELGVGEPAVQQYGLERWVNTRIHTCTFLPSYISCASLDLLCYTHTHMHTHFSFFATPFSTRSAGGDWSLGLFSSRDALTLYVGSYLAIPKRNVTGHQRLEPLSGRTRRTSKTQKKKTSPRH